MKKIFALALAAVMTAGMTTVAFADLDGVNLSYGGTTLVDTDKDDDGVYNDADDERFSAAVGSTVVIKNVDGGTKVAIGLLKGNSDVTKSEDVKGIKVDVDWSVGETETKPEIQFVKIGESYKYAIVFEIPENVSTKKSDLQGTLTLYTTSSEKKNPAPDAQVTLSVEYGYNTNKFDKVESDMTKAEIVDFSDEEDEITMDFGDLFTFEVNVTGQGKLNLVNNTDFNKEFAAMYDYANIDFITFENEPTFNKNGVAYIYADEDAFIYEVTADGAKEIAGLKWDEDYEAWTFKTRTLGAYAISDVELDEKTVTEDKDDASSTTDGGKTNPDTGR